MLGAAATTFGFLLAGALLPPLRRPLNLVQALLMLLHLTDLSPEPIHSQIFRQVRARILSGALDEAEPLPPVATIAREHRVAATSVERAFADLVTEGLVSEIPAVGFEVARLSEHAGDEHRRELARQRMFDALREQELSVKELELARDIQCRLLPPARVEGAGYVIGSRNDPARFVAGDFYDVIRHGDGTVSVVVADVAGKGVGASLIMASVKAVMPFVSSGRSVAETLGELNQKLRRELRRREFVALALARFDPMTGEVELANAGMPDPYQLDGGRRAGDQGSPPRPAARVRAIEVPGDRIPLGLRDHADYREMRFELEPGERLLMLSDGMPEAIVAGGAPLGYRRFEQLLRRAEGVEPDLWLDDLLERVRRRTPADRPRDDDWTALLLERRERSPSSGEELA